MGKSVKLYEIDCSNYGYVVRTQFSCVFVHPTESKTVTECIWDELEARDTLNSLTEWSFCLQNQNENSQKIKLRTFDGGWLWKNLRIIWDILRFVECCVRWTLLTSQFRCIETHCVHVSLDFVFYSFFHEFCDWFHTRKFHGNIHTFHSRQYLFSFICLHLRIHINKSNRTKLKRNRELNRSPESGERMMCVARDKSKVELKMKFTIFVSFFLVSASKTPIFHSCSRQRSYT